MTAIIVLAIIIAVFYAVSQSENKQRPSASNTNVGPSSAGKGQSSQMTGTPSSQAAPAPAHDLGKMSESTPIAVKSEEKAEPESFPKQEGPKMNPELVDYLRNERGVWFLVHFTPIDNLEGILKKGLLPRTKQVEKGKWSDDSRYDGCLDATSLSISFPNYQMLYRKRKEGRYHYIILKIDIEALNSVSGQNIAFFPENAASSSMFGTFNQRRGLPALKEMFAEEMVSKNSRTTRTQQRLPLYYTSSPQAEIMFRGTITPEYIIGIVTETDEDAATAEAVVRKCGCSIPVRADYQLFKYRKDFDFWSTGTGYTR